MATIGIFSMNKDELDDYLDTAKAVVIGNLVREGVMTEEEGHEYCKAHTVKMEKKLFWKSMFKSDDNEIETDNKRWNIIVVKKV